jgi:Fe-S cluster assembly protein SufD
METLVQAPAWVKERREQAATQFAAVGFPTTRNEDWRFTNIAPIAEAKFAPAQGVFAQAAGLIESVHVPGAVRLAIVNGEFVAALSDLSTLPKGLRIAGLRDGARDGTDGLETHPGRCSASTRTRSRR